MRIGWIVRQIIVIVPTGVNAVAGLGLQCVELVVAEVAIVELVLQELKVRVEEWSCGTVFVHVTMVLKKRFTRKESKKK